ncbi:hypothetical protein DER44DRAFT_737883 [Fusarium oxysporum]|nr:hypothetical protein DER44DRAFT_737883 [Fusarium oxysporum]
MGTNNVAAATATMRTSYVGLRLVLIVGVYSGLRRIANMDVFLGDVVNAVKWSPYAGDTGINLKDDIKERLNRYCGLDFATVDLGAPPRLTLNLPSIERITCTNKPVVDITPRHIPQHAQETAEGAYKLVGICSSETSLFEPLRKNMRGRWVRPPWGDMEYSVFLAVVAELHGVPRTGVPLCWLETELPKKGSIYRLTQDVDGEDGRRLILSERLGPKADMEEIVGYWQYTCEVSQGSHCSPKKPLGATLRGFKVINCDKKPLSPEPVPSNEKYTALSYL